MKKLLYLLIDNIAARTASFVMAQQADATERLLHLSGKQASRQIRSTHEIDTLEDVEFKVHSQWGEDGIIEWILQNLPLEHTTFIEFGVENYREANTRFLIQNRNWKGLIIDGNETGIESVRSSKLHCYYDLTAVSEFITRENINRIISESGFSGEIGLLSIDIDGNDYWVLEAIDCVNPAILICEYNPIFGDKYPVTIPYHPGFSRFEAHYSSLYFGASIAAVTRLADKKGYEFIGTNSNGINAFFVRRDLAHFITPLISQRKSHPSRHRDSRDRNGRLSYTGGLQRYDLIKHLPVIHLDTGEQLPLEALGIPYGPEWLKELDSPKKP